MSIFKLKALLRHSRFKTSKLISFVLSEIKVNLVCQNILKHKLNGLTTEYLSLLSKILLDCGVYHFVRPVTWLQ